MKQKHICIVCEGESEKAYIRQLQSFLDKQSKDFLPLRFGTKVAEGGYFHKIKKAFNDAKKENPRHSIEVWVDFPDYKKGDLSENFITVETLKNLKNNCLTNRIIPASGEEGFGDFAKFLIDEIESAFPDLLESSPILNSKF